MNFERNTHNRYRPRMKWYVKAIIVIALTTLIFYIGSMVYLVVAKYEMNDYVLEMGAAFNAATIVNATETHTAPENAVIAEYDGQSAVIVPENYKALQSYLRRDHAMPFMAFINKDKALHIAICNESHFYIQGDKDGQGATIRLESSNEKYTMHVSGGDLWDKILTVSLTGTSKSPNRAAPGGN